jgi:hypothetical protein
MTERAFRAGLSQLANDLQRISWRSRVLALEQGAGLINGGEDIGIQNGKTFRVLKRSNNEDPACRSGISALALPSQPLVDIEVYDAGATTSWGRVTKNYDNDPILVGAPVQQLP